VAVVVVVAVAAAAAEPVGVVAAAVAPVGVAEQGLLAADRKPVERRRSVRPGAEAVLIAVAAIVPLGGDEGLPAVPERKLIAHLHSAHQDVAVFRSDRRTGPVAATGLPLVRGADRRAEELAAVSVLALRPVQDRLSGPVIGLG
jgi:hypothetical protein